jgi:DNA-binding response OmpR family regulator
MTYRVLLVEDEPVVSSLLSAALSSVGYVVSCAGHGADAIRMCHSLLPDLLVVDLRLPFMNGLEFISTCRQDARLAAVPIIVISATTHPPETMARLRELGVSDFMYKPIEVRELRAVIASRLGRERGTDSTCA